MDISLRISALMKNKKMNKRSLSVLMGYSDVAVGKIINGKSKPKFEFLETLIRVFPDINPTWLLTGQGEMLNCSAGDNFSNVSNVITNTNKINRGDEQNVSGNNNNVGSGLSSINIQKLDNDLDAKDNEIKLLNDRIEFLNSQIVSLNAQHKEQVDSLKEIIQLYKNK